MDRSSPEYAQMKAAWHTLYGGSPKHDSPSEEFESGWECATQPRPQTVVHLMLDPMPYRNRFYGSRAIFPVTEDYLFSPREGFEQDRSYYKKGGTT